MEKRLIVFEGIDGVGKTTLVHALKESLLARGIKVIVYEDVEDTIHGYNQLKPFVKKIVEKKSINASLLFYLSSSLYKSELIKDLLKNQWVICDRYVYSTIAKHIAKGCGKILIPNMDIFPILKPDHAFLVTVKEQTRLTRLQFRKKNTKDDLIKKSRGTVSYRMEAELRKLLPDILINNDDVSSVIKKVMKQIDI